MWLRLVAGKVEVRMAPSPALASRGNSQAQLPPGSRTDAGDLILRPVALAFFFFFFSVFSPLISILFISMGKSESSLTSLSLGFLL